jgi:anti-sigma regulatory factor (Ser/Thr protein kinase)
MATRAGYPSDVLADAPSQETFDGLLMRAAASRARARTSRALRRAVHDRYAVCRPPPARLGTTEWHMAGDGPEAPRTAFVRVSVCRSTSAPQEVRCALAERLAPVLPAAALDDMQLLTSEVVTNAVVHGGGFEGTVLQAFARAATGTLMVCVTGPGNGFDAASARRTPGVDGGWGLNLVEQLSADWGVVRGAGRCSVWFRLRY